jgi:hypothetical protein
MTLIPLLELWMCDVPSYFHQPCWIAYVSSQYTLCNLHYLLTQIDSGQYSVYSADGLQDIDRHNWVITTHWKSPTVAASLTKLNTHCSTFRFVLTTRLIHHPAMHLLHPHHYMTTCILFVLMRMLNGEAVLSSSTSLSTTLSRCDSMCNGSPRLSIGPCWLCGHVCH